MFKRFLKLAARPSRRVVPALALAVSGAAVYLSKNSRELRQPAFSQSPPTESKPKHEVTRSDLPTYSRSEVAKHTTPETGIWVTYGQGVYDITDFAEIHPGGTMISLAYGNSLEPFWKLYAFHESDAFF
jgi:sulfite oxidase